MIVKTAEELKLLKQFISENDILSYDIETTGLNPRKDKIIGFGISNATQGYYVPHLVFNFETNQLEEIVNKQECYEILKLLQNKKWMGWNASFEARFTFHYSNLNIIDSMYTDPMLMKHTCDENRPFGLKEVAAMLFGTEAKDEQLALKESIKSNGGSEHEYFKADLAILAQYCIQDCLLTYKIYEHYLTDLNKQGLAKFFFEDEVMPLYKHVIIPMELKGVNLNIPLLENTRSEIIKDIQNLENSIQNQIAPLLDEFNIWFLNKELPPKRSGQFAQYLCKLCDLQLPKTKSGSYSIAAKALEAHEPHPMIAYLKGGDYLPESIVYDVQRLWLKDQDYKYPFNLSSKDHLKRLFFDRLGEEPINTTDLGNPQVDDLFLETMADKYEWAKDLRTLNKLNKIKGTYIERFLENHENGVYYPSWMMFRTVTGRLGGDMMQLPRKKGGEFHPLIIKHNNIIRDAIVSGQGYKLICADYESLEVVVFADDAGDEPLLDMIRNKEDFYSKVAIGVYGLENKYSADKKADNFLKNHEPKLRQDSKVYSLGLRYNMQSFKLSKTLNISQDEAQTIIDSYFKSYPKLKSRMDEITQFAKKNGYIKSKGGRIKHVPMLKKLSETYGDILTDSLKLWKKYKDSPAKYKSMQYLGKQYRADINACSNFPIQSMAATITNRACVALAKEIKRLNVDAYVSMQIHDEIIITCKEKEATRVAKLMQYLMENTTKLSVPLSAKPQIGNVYGEIK